MKLGTRELYQPIQSCICHLPRDIQQICLEARQEENILSAHIMYTHNTYTFTFQSWISSFQFPFLASVELTFQQN